MRPPLYRTESLAVPGVRESWTISLETSNGLLGASRRRPWFTTVRPAAVFLGAAASLILVGCSRRTGAVPGARVNVNLNYLVRLRPEWQGVEQLDARLASIQSTQARLAISPHAQPHPIQTAVHVNLIPLVLPATQPEDRRGLDEAVRVSTPSASTIRAELERETSGAQELFVQTAQADYRALVETAAARLKARYALLDVQIRRDDETQIINLRLRLHVLNVRLAQAKSGTGAALAITVSKTPPWTPIEAEIAKARGELIDLDSVLAARLAKNRAAMEAEFAAAEAIYRTSMLNRIAAHNQERQATIARQVAASRLDIEEESRQRQQFYQSAAFPSPLATELHAALPPSPQPSLGTPSSDNLALGAIAGKRQSADLIHQRDELEQYLFTDTQSWVQAIAAREHWTVSFTNSVSPSAGAGAPSDATPQLAVWIRDVTIPPAATR